MRNATIRGYDGWSAQSRRDSARAVSGQRSSQSRFAHIIPKYVSDVDRKEGVKDDSTLQFSPTFLEL